MMKGYREKRENIRTEKKVHHGVSLEQYGRKLVEEMSTNDLTRVDSLDLEQSQHANDGPIVLKEMLLLFTRLTRGALEGGLFDPILIPRERRDQSLSLSTE
jgi:hypothetical protein